MRVGLIVDVDSSRCRKVAGIESRDGEEVVTKRVETMYVGLYICLGTCSQFIVPIVLSGVYCEKPCAFCMVQRLLF